jgi:hypothetical protein
MNSKYKNIIIIILSLAVIGSMYFREDNSIYKDELQRLKIENIMLKTENDSLDVININLEKDIALINDTLNIKDSILIIKDDKIKKLQSKRHEISNRVNTMDGNGVADSFTEYLSRRSKNGN